MLTRPISRHIHSTLRASQRGVVLMITLIVLVVMTLAGIALIRSVDTSNIIAGNLAFQQAATYSGSVAVENAISWLESCNAGTGGCAAGTLNTDSGGPAGNGYAADGNNPNQSPAAGQTWDAYWRATLATRPPVTLVTDVAGNTSSYIIDRLCTYAGSPTGGASCASSPLITTATGNSEEANEIQLNAPSLVYYRITVRTTGPKNALSYIQVITAL